ncbi:hypothetical protein DE146DRAFT_640597 [Phaeosphaeria sp. MPI-PUGE-AT-0046c]|nr:hypothetical protein DE146DRAFT_640597 [Phaeosphaeria sp. MPI-PUGE-AT-0046c]
MFSQFVLTLGAFSPFITFSSAAPVDNVHGLVARDLTIDSVSCGTNVGLITQELGAARSMAQKGKTLTASSQYYQTIFSTANKNTPGFELVVQGKYGKLFDLSADKNKKYTIECKTDACGGTRNAWTDPTQGIINLCPRWFDNAVKARTVDIIGECRPGSPNAGKWANLAQFKGSKAFTLLHEMTHLDYITGDIPNRARDYAYQLQGCKDLAAGTAMNEKLCGQGKTCDPIHSIDNADSIAFVVAGEYFSSMCGKTITTNSDTPMAKDGAPDDQDNIHVVYVVPVPVSKRDPPAAEATAI